MLLKKVEIKDAQIELNYRIYKMLIYSFIQNVEALL